MILCPENTNRTMVMSRSRARRKSVSYILHKMMPQNIRRNIHPVFVVLLAVSYLRYFFLQKCKFSPILDTIILSASSKFNIFLSKLSVVFRSTTSKGTPNENIHNSNYGYVYSIYIRFHLW